MSKLAEVMMIFFFLSVYTQTFREIGESSALELAPMTGWIPYVQQYAQHLLLIKDVSLCYVWLLWHMKADLNCVFGHVDLLTPYKTARYNRRLQHFLKQILNAMCFLKMRKQIWMFTGYYHSSEEMDQREKETMHWIGERRHWKQNVLAV